MNTLKKIALTALTLAALCASTLSLAQTTLKVSAIPDENPTELQRKFKPLGAYLEAKLGMKVEFVPVTDYAAVVEALAAKKIDMAWLGGFTFVQSNIRSGGKATPLVQRAEDEKFKSVFITSDASIQKLEDLRGKTLAFGSESSTSGHLMPRSFLLQAGIKPDTDLRRIAFTGAHDATVKAVEGGQVAAGALNISVWEKLVTEKKVDTTKVRVFFTTPGYYDYNWTVHSDMDTTTKKKITDAFLALDANTPAGKEILDLQRASKFIATKASNYDGITAAAKNAGLIK